MKIGIIGLPKTGKKTLFEALTQNSLSEKDTQSDRIIQGVAEIRDPRFDSLIPMYKPKKQTRARINIELLPKIEKDTVKKGDIFKDIAELDAICHVVRVFKDESVYHASGSIDAKRDIDFVNAELIINDLLFIEKRLDRIEKDLKKTRAETTLKEKELLLKLKEHLEKEKPLRLLSLEDEEKKIISGYPFITLKKIIIVLNVSEGEIGDSLLLTKLNKIYEEEGVYLMQASVKVEAEIMKLETEEERTDFLKALGIDEPALNILSRLCMKALNLVSFFTVGSDEVHQWTIPAGSSAPEAAGSVHTDLKRGFIRAEVMKQEDLIKLGSEEKVKESGKFYIKGKDYIVEDGDIICIRFNI
ncbi:MAG: redox-regulated ATPase YchF [Candidatus Omnitrophica bacterium]|nr:redox-regulated ATPase YchF [Candidatus Omnitrophota bacterium]